MQRRQVRSRETWILVPLLPLTACVTIVSLLCFVPSKVKAIAANTYVYSKMLIIAAIISVTHLRTHYGFMKIRYQAEMFES